MQGLHLLEIEDWCSQHGIEHVDDWRVPGNSSLTYSDFLRISDPLTREVLSLPASTACLEVLGRWDECLLWIRETGIADNENWPAFYALRGEDGELNSLDERPGHLFSWEERERLGIYMTGVISNLWDAFIFPVTHGEPETIRMATSHDEFVDLWSSTPRKFPPLAAPT